MTAKKKPKKARRGRGEGGVTQRPDGSWQGQLSLGTTAAGKRRREFVNAPTKFECLELMARKRAQFGQGTLVSADAATVESFLVRWVAAITGTIEGSTLDSYERNIRLWINPQVGHIRVQKLDMLHVEALIAHMRTESKSPRTIQYVRSILRRAFDDAVKWGLIASNVIDRVKAPAPRQAEFQVWDETQTNAAIQASESERLGLITAIGLLTGLREGEILALQWPDIDLKHNRLHVRRTQSMVKGQIILKPPKTKAGTRTVPYSDALAGMINTHRARMLRDGWLNQPFVFVDREGQMLDRFGQVKSTFNRITKAAGLPPIGFHDLRHTHATLLLRAGVNPKVVQERLGHSTVQITLQLYSHVMPVMQTEAVDKLNKLLG